MGLIIPITSKRVPEHCTEVGAQALARRLQLFWKHRGVEIETWIDPCKTQSDGAVYGVRSKFPNNKIPNT